jgi:hypothetical protein
MALCCLSAVLLLSSCNDTLSEVGTSILPPEDVITVQTDTFTLTAQTIQLDSVYAKTTQCLLGQMYDPLYGSIKADFLCQFYCEENFRFANTPYQDKIDSMELVVMYFNSSWYGDTLAPMQASVYEINKPLKRNFYTNDNPENYSNMSQPLGRQTYTAYDLSLYDSVAAVAGNLHYITVKLPTELGQKFYDETVNNPSTFASQEAFNQFFPGVYVTTTFGSGSLIRTEGENIFLRIYYNYLTQDTLGQDTLIRAAAIFTNSKEVIQISRFENQNTDNLFVPNNTHTFVKSPAGVCTRLTIPTSQIAQKIDVKNRYINDFTLNLHYLPTEEWNFALAPPEHLLLIPEDSVKTFFEEERVENNQSIYVSYGSGIGSYVTPVGVNSATRTYNFGNISALIKSYIEQAPEKDLNVLIIPVTRTSTLVQQSVYATTGMTNSLVPSGIKIRIDEDYMKVVAVSSEYENR